MKFTHSAHIMPKAKPVDNNRPVMWGMLTAGLAIGFMGMYFSVTRPMSMRMQMVESNLSLMQAEMHQLVGTRDNIWKTNDLLTGLRQQQRQLAEVEQSLVAIKQVNNEVIALSSNHELAMRTIHEVETLQTALIENKSSMAQSREVIANIAMLQQSVVKLGSSAQSQQSGIVAATKALSDVEKLTSRVISQKELIAQADTVIDSVDELSSLLIQQEEPLSASKNVVTDMAALQGDLVRQGEMIPVSLDTVQKMASLETALAGRDQATVMQAASNLKEMMKFQDELSAGGQRITDAIQTIELLEGFQAEIEIQTGLLSKMRRDLMEITFLESTVNQTLLVLKPLIQLSDLRRMSNTEIREAARVILDRRTADSRSDKNRTPEKIAERKIESPKISTEGTSTQEQVVPAPTDLE